MKKLLALSALISCVLLMQPTDSYAHDICNFSAQYVDGEYDECLFYYKNPNTGLSTFVTVPAKFAPDAETCEDLCLRDLPTNVARKLLRTAVQQTNGK